MPIFNFCPIHGVKLKMRYPGGDPENGPARPACPHPFAAAPREPGDASAYVTCDWNEHEWLRQVEDARKRLAKEARATHTVTVTRRRKP